MTIVAMKKATLFGMAQSKAAIMDELQTLGCLHLLPFVSQNQINDESTNTASPSKKALRFLMDFQPRHHQVHNDSHFDAATVEAQSLDLIEKLQELNDERDYLQKHIEDLSPWGQFRFPDIAELGGNRLWFYIVPHYRLQEIDKNRLIWHAIHRDNRFVYLVVISEHEPANMPVPRMHTGHLSLYALKQGLEFVESEIDDIQAQRYSLTRWVDLLAANLAMLEDRATLNQACDQTYDDEGIFVVQGWLPSTEEDKFKEFVERHQLALVLHPPSEKDNPPTLLRNPKTVEGGQSLTQFYLTPSYNLWDPSGFVLYSFALFFAMIMSDAGYAGIYGIITLLLWKKMGRSKTGRDIRQLFLLLTISSLLWGVLVGSYFGASPAKETALSRLHIFDMNDKQAMMQLSIIIGILHLLIANLSDAWQRRQDITSRASLGWGLVIIGATLYWLAYLYNLPMYVIHVSLVLDGMGILLILLFSSRQKGWHGLILGVLALTRATNAFGDILSYLRLFALGLASASLAFAFNDLAKSLIHSTPAFGVLAALIVLFLGHGLNFALATVSGFVHGLRLNFIEFFNWSINEEGLPFRAFAKKENRHWIK